VRDAPPLLVVMGVSGTGKSTVGPLLAAALGVPFADGDAFHPPANVAKMSAGTPLTDEDRWPWLAAIAGWLGTRGAAGGVVACSTLRRAYRDRLRTGAAGLRFVHLAGDRALIGARQAARPGHFMPASLIDSQFAALEDPAGEADVIAVSVVPPPEAVVRAVLDALGGREGA
jgi:gluconokinase